MFFHVQEVERKARKQFKGLFDMKTGEIADPNPEDREFETASEGQDGDSDEINSEKSCEGAPDQDGHRIGWFSLFWSSSRRFISSLGLQRCTLL